MPNIQDVKAAIRDVPDFPKPGILFKDINPILADSALFRASLDALAETVSRENPTKVAGIDARGFIFASGVATILGIGFVPIRKKGKLPWSTHEESYELEYGQATVEIQQDAVAPGERIALIDDLLATGGTAAAAVKLLNKLEAELVATSFLIELAALNGREKIETPNIHSIISY